MCDLSPFPPLLLVLLVLTFIPCFFVVAPRSEMKWDEKRPNMDAQALRIAEEDAKTAQARLRLDELRKGLSLIPCSITSLCASPSLCAS